MNGIEVCFSGRVGHQPAELKTSASGKTWCWFTAAVNTGEGEATWLKVSVFDSRAGELVGSLQKGDRVYCEGRLRLSSWTGADGQPRTGLEVAAWRVDLQGQIGKHRDPRATTLHKREGGRESHAPRAD